MKRNATVEDRRGMGERNWRVRYEEQLPSGYISRDLYEYFDAYENAEWRADYINKYHN